jgi:hypothetical protein
MTGTEGKILNREEQGLLNALWFFTVSFFGSFCSVFRCNTVFSEKLVEARTHNI